MKNSWKVALLSAGFIAGVLYGVSSGTPLPQQTQTAVANVQLEEQLRRYEQTIAEGQEFRPPYSEQIAQGDIGQNQLQQPHPTKSQTHEVVNQPTNPLPMQEPISQINDQNMQNPLREVGHNIVSQFGHGMGEFLMMLVRETLRAMVKFFDDLITL